MAIIEKIIELNKAGKPIVWPSTPKVEKCTNCWEDFSENTMTYGYCENCWESLSPEDQMDEITTQACIAAGR